MSLKFAPSDYEIYIPIAEWIEKNIKEWLFLQRPLFKKISAPIDTVLNGLDSLFNFIPFPIAVLIFLYFAYKTNGLKFSVITFLGLIFIDLVDLWSESMTTLAMIFTAVIFCILIGIPLGIFASRSKTFEIILRPILDIMQTIPSFVYLIPVVMLFRVGDFTAMIAVILYALAPAVRYTAHGVRNINNQIVEAALISGCSPRQLLFKIKLPLALPEILLGINQTIMLALSMLVITALVGTRDLGQEVYIGLTKADIGRGLVAGLCVAFISIIADRIIKAGSNNLKNKYGIK